MKCSPHDRRNKKSADTRKPHRAENISVSYDEWQAAVEEANIQRITPIPPGWLSMVDYADKMGLGISGATSQIRKLITAGKVEISKFLVMREGVPRSIPHYRLKSK